jgi:hypothetical protein
MPSTVRLVTAALAAAALAAPATAHAAAAVTYTTSGGVRIQATAASRRSP